MLIMPSFRKSLIVEHFQGNYLKQLKVSLKKCRLERDSNPKQVQRNGTVMAATPVHGMIKLTHRVFSLM